MPRESWWRKSAETHMELKNCPPGQWVREEQNTHLLWAKLTKKHGAHADKEYGQ